MKGASPSVFQGVGTFDEKCRHIWRKLSAHLMQWDNHSPCFGRNLCQPSGETYVNLRAKPSSCFERNLCQPSGETFVRLCLSPTGNRYFCLHHIDTSILFPLIPYSFKYSSHLNPFLGMKSLKSVVQNIIRLLHHRAISFCHLGMT